MKQKRTITATTREQRCKVLWAAFTCLFHIVRRQSLLGRFQKALHYTTYCQTLLSYGPSLKSNSPQCLRATSLTRSKASRRWRRTVPIAHTHAHPPKKGKQNNDNPDSSRMPRDLLHLSLHATRFSVLSCCLSSLFTKQKYMCTFYTSFQTLFDSLTSYYKITAAFSKTASSLLFESNL